MSEQVLVFTMNKVGSTTVMRTLQNAGVVAGRAHPNNLDYFGGIEHLMDDYGYCVSTMRDPVARNISQYWELHGEELMKMELQEQIDYFFKWLGEDDNFMFPINWWQDYFAEAFGFNPIYSSEAGIAFNRKTGFCVYQNKFLVTRTENLSETLAKGLSIIFKRDESEFVVEHRAETELTRPYGKAYQKFVKAIKFDAKTLDLIYDNQTAKVFYYAQELTAFRNKWQAK